MSGGRIQRRRLGAGEPIHLLPAGAGRPDSISWRGRRHRVIGWSSAGRQAAGLGLADGIVYQVETRDGLRALISPGLRGRPWRMEAVLGRNGG
jgi:hypothetical protein